jgi:hypothetical protein
MKNVILTAVALALVTISCNQKKQRSYNENEIVVTDTTVITNDGTSTGDTVLIEKTPFVKETTKRKWQQNFFLSDAPRSSR